MKNQKNKTKLIQRFVLWDYFPVVAVVSCCILGVVVGVAVTNGLLVAGMNYWWALATVILPEVIAAGIGLRLSWVIQDKVDDKVNVG